MLKTCIVCGRTFQAKNPNRKYCTDKCRKKAYNRNKTLRNGGTPQDEAGSLCWTCIYAVPNPEMRTGCSWSRSVGKIPVEGSEYKEKAVFPRDNNVSRKAILKIITKCPKYQRECIGREKQQCD